MEIKVAEINAQQKLTRKIRVISYNKVSNACSNIATYLLLNMYSESVLAEYWWSSFIASL